MVFITFILHERYLASPYNKFTLSCIGGFSMHPCEFKVFVHLIASNQYTI